jgi:hypothetical protein
MYWEDYVPYFVFIVSVLIFVVAPGFLLYAVFTHEPPPCIVYSKVVTIGGCDKYGECGVTTESGASVVARYPTVGQNVCVKWEKKS